MFVSLWLIFLTSGLLLATATLLWSLKTNQFEEQERARYLPLVGLSREELAQAPPIKRGAAFYGIMLIFAGGALAIGMTLVVVIRHL
ncbi:MAG: hypothetical protein Kow0090_13680 [Myxococcota bacterium]